MLGAGPIGNLVAQAAKGMGAAKVMITDVSDLRLDKAKECGIDVCVNTKEKDFGEAMLETFGPDKADVIYDCAEITSQWDRQSSMQEKEVLLYWLQCLREWQRLILQWLMIMNWISRAQ